MREIIYSLLEGPRASLTELWFRSALLLLILLNGAAVVVASVEPWGTRYEKEFLLFEYISVAIFTIEYLARVLVCTVDPNYRAPLSGRLRFALRPLMLIDLLSILPSYLPLLVGADLRILRILRITRLLRLFKIARYFSASQRIKFVLRKHAPDIVITIFGGLLILAISSALLYQFERNSQPEVFTSIPAAAWVAISALTPIGSGSMGPETPAGKLIAAFSALIGVGIIALPSGILARAFMQDKPEPTSCPHCGKKLNSASE